MIEATLQSYAASKQHTLSPLTVSSPENFRNILGDDWLKSREAILDYSKAIAVVKRNKR